MESFSCEEKEKLAISLRRWDIRPGQFIFEPGCGSGRLTQHLAQVVGPTGHVTAIDLSPDMLDVAKQKIDQHAWQHITLREMDALALDFPDETFDYVTIFHVVSVVPDVRRMMREIVRVCKPGGVLVIINHFRSPRRWVAVPVDLLDPFTRHLGWRTTLTVDTLLEELPIRVEDDFKTSWNSLFRVIVARKLGALPCTKRNVEHF